MGTKKILKAFLFSFLFAGILHLMSISDALGDLTNDFTPCSGKPANPMFVETQRLLLATSNNGLDFTRKNQILADRATVPDAVVLSNGRILVYYVAACKITGGQEVKTNEIVVAVSDDNGNNWFYKNVTFKNLPSGPTNPVDPNVVLLPNGNLRMFATVDPDIEGPQKARTYSFLSTDGGFTYVSEGERFSLFNEDVLDPEIFRFSDTNWKLWAGNKHAISTDGNNFTYQGPTCYVQDGSYCSIVADIVNFATYYRMYVHGGSPTSSRNNWIKSLVSTDTTNWTLEAGNRLTVDPSTGLESEALLFPTVVGLKNGTYLMVYQTTIAYSEPTTNNLTILKDGTGSGTVTSNPTGISCGSDCSESYPANTLVTLTATPDQDSTFGGWGGDCSSCDTNYTCQITMNTNKACVATFTKTTPTFYSLNVTKSGTGSGTVTSNPTGISCGSDCSESYPANTLVTLTATPDQGSKFGGWAGDCSSCGSNYTCQITMDTNKACVATFMQMQENVAGVGDFNGDGKADILWRNTSTGMVTMWLMNGTSKISEATVLSAGNTAWTVAGVGDFNGDGKADILWRNTSTGMVTMWLMNGTSMSSWATILGPGSTDWTVAGVGDFNGDGKADILWRNISTGTVTMWPMNGTSKISEATILNAGNTDWTVAGVGDFNGNGKADILWRNSSTGMVTMWLMDGTSMTNWAVLVGYGNQDWNIPGTGKFDGDSNFDILWRSNSTGMVTMWFMNGISLKSWGTVVQ